MAKGLRPGPGVQRRKRVLTDRVRLIQCCDG